MLLLRSLLFDLFFYLLMLVMGVICAPVAAFSRRATRRIMRLYCRIVLAVLAGLCGLRTEVRGEIPEGDVLIAAKHQSFLDIILLMRHLPRPRFIMKRELQWLPIFGLYALRLGCIPVNRASGGRALRQMLREVVAGAASGGQLVIYPQGTRVAPGAEASYRPGAGAMYAALDWPAVPVATNAGHFWGRQSLLRRPGLAVVSFLPEIAAGASARAFMQTLEAQVEEASATLDREAEQWTS
ncbi:MAG: lysophospholipid acyltransferase family protein [Pseudomonadota bacterium]